MQLVFGRDAFLPVSFQANWNYIANRKQRLIVQNNARKNAKRKIHVYRVGDRLKTELWGYGPNFGVKSK